MRKNGFGTISIAILLLEFFKENTITITVKIETSNKNIGLNTGEIINPRIRNNRFIPVLARLLCILRAICKHGEINNIASNRNQKDAMKKNSINKIIEKIPNNNK